MAEVIGVAASATQLATACFSLIDVVKKIKGATSTLKKYHQQLRDLTNLSTCIAENPLLQTPEVGVQTQAILLIIKNNGLNSLLRKGRLLRTWGLLYREQDLLETFVQLERQKTNLSLAIEHIQSKALYQIRTDIQKMADKQGPSSPNNDISTASVTFHSTPQCSNQVAAGLATAASSSNFVDPTLIYLIEAASRRQQPDHNVSSSSTAAQYSDMWAAGNVTQNNGGVFEMSVDTSQDVSSKGLTPSVHTRPVKFGSGNQINGHEFIRTDDKPGFQVPKNHEDRWHNGICSSSSHATEPAAKQINGNVIRDFKKV